MPGNLSDFAAHSRHDTTDQRRAAAMPGDSHLMLCACALIPEPVPSLLATQPVVG